jgi:8-oxo-dGTP pyrophosphatase MutT (NUDIX family)
MQVIYAQEPFPTTVRASIFLAGPTPRDKANPSWRPEALRLLEGEGFDGHVFVPEPRGGIWKGDYIGQVGWEEEGLNRADSVVFWIPRDMATMPGLTTNDEWGTWKDSGKAVFGAPEGAAHVRYQAHYAAKLGVPSFKTLPETLKAAMVMVGTGAERSGGACTVPLHIWKLESFQSWYKAQTSAGNRLDGLRVGWTFRVGLHRSITFLWVAHVDVFVASENRNKKNEFVIGRTDIATVVLWHRAPTLQDTEIALVKEFRSPARTPDAFIHELPGGSSKSTKPAIQTAIEEVSEEIGILLTPNRLKELGTRQLAGTLSSFSGTLFSAELTSPELTRLKMDAAAGVTRGVASDTEKTYVEVVKVGDLLKNSMADWSTIGMIFAALSEAMR